MSQPDPMLPRRLSRVRKRIACALQGHIWADEVGVGYGYCVRCGKDVEG